MRSEEQLAESVGRFRESFWERRAADRPPVGVVRREVYMPSLYRREHGRRAELQPGDVGPHLAATDYEYAFARRAISCDDFIAFSAPWRGVPWLEAACGCPVRCAEGCLAPEPFVKSLDELAERPIPAENGWLACMERQTEQLLAAAPPDCWVSPTILRGCSDVLGAMRGQVGFFLDLNDSPDRIREIAGRVTRLLIDALDRHYALVPAKLGGFTHVFGYWAPGRTAAIQEDAMCMCAPEVYRDVFREHNAAVVQHLGDCVLFHMHSAGYQHLREVLAIPGLAGVQITMDPTGPAAADMLPVFREVLHQSRLILWAKQGCRGLVEVLRELPNDGLYVMVPDADITCDAEFREFATACWKSL